MFLPLFFLSLMASKLPVLVTNVSQTLGGADICFLLLSHSSAAGSQLTFDSVSQRLWVEAHLLHSGRWAISRVCARVPSCLG